jgi:hypothetical protein
VWDGHEFDCSACELTTHLYKQLNCLARHPELAVLPKRVFVRPLGVWYLVDDKRKNTWSAGYNIEIETPKGPRSALVSITEVTTDECPKSVLLRNPEAAELIQIFRQSQSAPMALGPASRWPAAFYDAMAILKTQQEIDRRAYQRAVHSIN